VSNSRVRPGPPKKAVPPISISVSITPRLLSVREVALYLGGVTEWFVEEELLRSGEVPYRMLGNQKVVERTDLDQWLDKQKKLRGKLEAPLIVQRRVA
jgi:excisionase family DNA binding protein